MKKKPGRKRRVAGWTLLLLGLLVAGVWVWSRWYAVNVYSRKGSITLHNGLLSFGAHAPASHLRQTEGIRWSVIPNPEIKWHWWMGVRWGAGSPIHNFGVYGFVGPSANAPLRPTLYMLFIWPIPLLLWTPAALLLRSGILARRRATQGMCAKCGYSLAGLAAGAPCPECGKGAKVTA